MTAGGYVYLPSVELFAADLTEGEEVWFHGQWPPTTEGMVARQRKILSSRRAAGQDLNRLARVRGWQGNRKPVGENCSVVPDQRLAPGWVPASNKKIR